MLFICKGNCKQLSFNCNVISADPIRPFPAGHGAARLGRGEIPHRRLPQDIIITIMIVTPIIIIIITIIIIIIIIIVIMLTQLLLLLLQFLS